MISLYHKICKTSFNIFRQKLGSKKENPIDQSSETSTEITTSSSELSDTPSSCLSANSSFDITHSSSYSNLSWRSEIPVVTVSEEYNAPTEPQLLPQFVDTFFTPQTCRNRTFFSALYRPTGLLTVCLILGDSFMT